jgi:D-isomer specific 2-hydroxyacid dehydrogenase, NAD binding domain
VQVVHTGYFSSPTIELTWALILGSARNLVAENTSLRGGGWQQTVGDDMAGRTLGVLGLGNVGGAVAEIGNAFGMKVIAWSQNLTAERAAEVGATLVSKSELFQEADVVSIHLVLGGRTRGLVGAAELALMKPTARIINTSRGPIVVEADLVAALKDNRIAWRSHRCLRPGAAAARPSAPRAAEPAGDAAYRLRLPRAIRALLPGHGREHQPLARQPSRVLTLAAALEVTIMVKLQGKLAVVTGGTAGIGFATPKGGDKPGHDAREQQLTPYACDPPD